MALEKNLPCHLLTSLVITGVAKRIDDSVPYSTSSVIWNNP